MLVEQLMATDVITTTPDATLKEVDELFSLNAISGAPVLDDGLLVGVISQSDVIRVLYDQQVAANEVSQYFLSPYPISMPSVSAITMERSKIADRIVNTTVNEAMPARRHPRRGPAHGRRVRAPRARHRRGRPARRYPDRPRSGRSGRHRPLGPRQSHVQAGALPPP